MARHFLFLQGSSSPLFRKTGRELAALGHATTRINFCAGDWMFWHGSTALSYRGRLEDWPAFLTDFCRAKAVTDLVLLGAERPYHRPAVAVAQMLGLEVAVVEMGYFRPDWIALERGGMTTNSHFPNSPGLIEKLAAGLSAPDFRQRFSQRFSVEALDDLAFHLPNVFLRFLFPFYRRYGLDHPFADYGGWLRKFAFRRRRERETAEVVDRLERAGTPFFLFPLQLETDYQIRSHSPFASQFDAIDRVLNAFATSASAEQHLVVKIHPLDNGLRNWQKHCAELAVRLGLGDRVHFLHGGDLGRLLARSSGVVTINSTVGVRALLDGKPVKVLGTALFDVEGLCDQRALDEFFRLPRLPDRKLRDAFVALVAAAIHVRGTFYSAKGSSAGAKAIADRLHHRTVNEPGAYVPIPPRRKALPPRP